MSEPTPTDGTPREARGRIFLRFLRFGLLAWGGPVAQIAMIREELVEREKWVSSERFNRVLAVYQVLPGPEANELCVYFGRLAGGWWGGLLAGLGFLLPGLLLMLLCRGRTSTPDSISDRSAVRSRARRRRCSR